MKTAILIDGAFYRKRALFLWGKKKPEERAKELMAYCNAHLDYLRKYDDTDLYRIFYYDCPPISKTVYHPLLQRGIDFRHSETYSWTNLFFEELIKCRKVALRLGELADEFAHFDISPSKLKLLCRNEITISDLDESDFTPSFRQKCIFRSNGKLIPLETV